LIQCSTCRKEEEKPELVIKFYKRFGKVEAVYYTNKMRLPKRMDIRKAIDTLRFNSIWLADRLYKDITFIGAKYANKLIKDSSK